MMENYSESDEAFARRLQAQEMGNFTHRNHGPVDAQTPLVNRGPNENPTVLNARINEVTSSRISMYVLLFVYGPQVLASFIVLGLHWGDKNVCDGGHTLRWKWWALLSALRMLAFLFIVYFMDIYRVWLQEHREYGDRMKSIRNTIDVFGLIWFVVGNMWLFGDDNNICHHPERSPIYNLCVSLLVLNYVQICFPCIIAIILIPVFCFCMPCLIRLVARLQDPRASQGASDAILETLPEVIVDASHIRVGQDNTCPICLSEMALGESARVLRCTHIFHKQCVDEWLRVNASCPTCRKRIIDSPTTGPSNTSSSSSGATGTAAPNNAGNNSGGGNWIGESDAAAPGMVTMSPLVPGAGGRMSIHTPGEVALSNFGQGARAGRSAGGAASSGAGYSLLPTGNNNSSNSGGADDGDGSLV